jgi:asparaginyl-tRNA synthetase
MIEPEIAFADLEDNMRLAEDYLKFCVQFVLDNCDEDLAFFEEKKIEEGLRDRLRNVVKEPFQKITYTAAIELLLKDKRAKKVKFNRKLEKKDPLRWGIDLRSEHEKYLTEQVYKKPVIVTDYPASFKAFYMRMNDGCEKDRQTVRGVRARSARISLLSFTYSEDSLVSLAQLISLSLVTLLYPSLSTIPFECYGYT